MSRPEPASAIATDNIILTTVCTSGSPNSDSNVFIGGQAGTNSSVTASNSNVGIGFASANYVTGSYNVGSGTSASVSVVGSLNSGLGASYITRFGDNLSIGITGSYNTASGAYAGKHVTGNADISSGLSAGSSVTGINNIASGTMAGSNVVGSGNSAIGLSAGSAGVAQASTQSQARMLESLAPLANSLTLRGNKNIAIGTNAGTGNGTPFSDTVAIGTSASASQSSSIAIAAGVASEARSCQDSFALGASVTPGRGDIGLQTGMQWQIGRGGALDPPPSLDEWRRLGFTHIDEIIPNRRYLCINEGQTYRISIVSRLDEHDSWRAKIDQSVIVDGLHISWERTALARATASLSPATALRRSIVALAASVVPSR